MAALECRGMGLIAAFVIHGNCGEVKCGRCKVDSNNGADERSEGPEAFLCHAENMCRRLWKKRQRNCAWPGDTKHAIRQARVYVPDLKDSSQCIYYRSTAHGGKRNRRTYLESRRYIDRALEPAVLEFLHRIHGETRVCVGKEGRGPSLARDGEPTIIRQMHAYLLLLETWYLKSSSDETGLWFIAYF
jgi:hypothetical protein